MGFVFLLLGWSLHWNPQRLYPSTTAPTAEWVHFSLQLLRPVLFVHFFRTYTPPWVRCTGSDGSISIFQMTRSVQSFLIHLFTISLLCAERYGHIFSCLLSLNYSCPSCFSPVFSVLISKAILSALTVLINFSQLLDLNRPYFHPTYISIYLIHLNNSWRTFRMSNLASS